MVLKKSPQAHDVFSRSPTAPAMHGRGDNVPCELPTLLVHGACSVLSLTGNASNFALYCLAGSRFRRALRDAVRDCTRRIATWWSTLSGVLGVTHCGNLRDILTHRGRLYDP